MLLSPYFWHIASTTMRKWFRQAGKRSDIALAFLPLGCSGWLLLRFCITLKAFHHRLFSTFSSRNAYDWMKGSAPIAVNKRYTTVLWQAFINFSVIVLMLFYVSENWVPAHRVNFLTNSRSQRSLSRPLHNCRASSEICSSQRNNIIHNKLCVFISMLFLYAPEILCKFNITKVPILIEVWKSVYMDLCHGVWPVITECGAIFLHRFQKRRRNNMSYSSSITSSSYFITTPPQVAHWCDVTRMMSPALRFHYIVML